MSLGLPEFGSRGEDPARGAWRAVQIAGLVALAYAAAIAVTEGLAASAADQSRQKASAEVAAMAQSAESSRRTLLRNPDLLIAATSVASAPDRVIADMEAILPAGVSVVSYKIDYQQDASAHLDLVVVAGGPEAYDRFLSALSKSKHFSDIRPGAEIRPGLVRATVAAVHRPKGSER